MLIMKTNVRFIYFKTIIISMAIFTIAFTASIRSEGVNCSNDVSLLKSNELDKKNIVYDDLKNLNEAILDEKHNLHKNSSSKTENIKKVSKEIEISNSTPLSIETAKIIVDYCDRLDLPVSLVLALIELESNFNQYEVGADNDRGFCQIIPGTEKWLAETHGHKLGLKYDPKRIFEPEYNIGLGMLYLHILKRAYGENYHKILSEYNRGIYNLKKYYDKHGTYVTSYSRGVLSREEKYISFNKN